VNRLLDRSTTGQLGLVVAGTVVLALVGLLFPSGYVAAFAFQLLTWVVLAVSWSLFSGNSGYASFAHGVFFGVGIYITAALLRTTDLPFVVIMLIAGAAAGLLALVVGLAVFSSPRFAGDLFGLITLALAFIAITVVSNTPWLDGGTGVFVREHVEGTWIGGGTLNLYLVATLLTGLTCVVAVLAWKTRWGAALQAVRDDEHVAESLGVATYRQKVLAFAASATLAGLVGAPQAVFLGYIEVGTVFALNIPLFVLMMVILGGIGRWWGAVIGAVLVVVLREALLGLGSAEFAQILVGAALIIVIVVMPRGVSGFLTRWARRTRGAVS
jgi:branched-chain amino acid transport system permease protein